MNVKSKVFRKWGLPVIYKKWRTPRFRTQAGFNNVIGIKGDKDYSTDAYARIELSMSLK